MRRSPLKRGKPLKRGAPLRAKHRIKPVSDKRRVEREDYRDAVMEMHARSGWRCAAEALVPEVRCGGPLDPHHVKLRGPHYADAESLAQVCRRHHDWITTWTREARKRGLLA
ncbi:MAG TPA: hypothetical protein VMU09_11125 [Acidimicrobiales bacterium]|nr:hypothetical protein [Acidimicrobiales bacterium]